jgi:hypothetical protein
MSNHIYHHDGDAANRGLVYLVMLIVLACLYWHWFG